MIFIAACGIWFLDKGWDPASLHWERGVLATHRQGSSRVGFSVLYFQWKKRIVFFQAAVKEERLNKKKTLTTRFSFGHSLTRALKFWGWVNPLNPPTPERPQNPVDFSV